MIYPQLEDGEPLFIDKGNVLRFACCDCDLVHDIRFEVVENKGIKMTMFRNRRSTGQLRRHQKDYSNIVTANKRIKELEGYIQSWKQDEIISMDILTEARDEAGAARIAALEEAVKAIEKRKKHKIKRDPCSECGINGVLILSEAIAAVKGIKR